MASQAAQEAASEPSWTYPTRFCRICREDVSPTVTMYPPGLPPSMQRPIVEYVNEDEYGRLIKPCLCRGGMRYIHELCLLKSRTLNNRQGSMWKCHECGHQFNFQKLAVQRFLSSKYSSGVLTVMVMLFLIFTLGFVADPIINLYADPYDTLMGYEPIWTEVQMQAPDSKSTAWFQHFVKGFVSMGLVGFLKTIILNPFQWFNFRHSGVFSSRTTSTTGRDRAVNISWIAVIIGVCSAFYFFYQWVQTIIQKALLRIGNRIVNTQLPGDDDDLKPPPGWKAETIYAERPQSEQQAPTEPQPVPLRSFKDSDLAHAAAGIRSRASAAGMNTAGVADGAQSTGEIGSQSRTEIPGAWTDDGVVAASGYNSLTQDAISQGWSFADL